MGETGVGKSLFIERFLDHHKKKYPKAKNKRINISAIPETLLESELFGHKKGAFTGAIKSYDGILGILKDNDVLVLEEVGELLPEYQAKLLTVMESGEYFQLHNTETKKTKDFFFIGTTNKKPGDLRLDFYQRFLTFYVPSLRERRSDIKEYAEALCPAGWNLIRSENRELNRRGKGVRIQGSQTEMVFFNYDWPGNVREMLNYLETLKVLHSAWSYKPSPQSKRKQLNIKESLEYQAQKLRLYEAIESSFSLQDKSLTRIALSALAPDESIRKDFLKHWDASNSPDVQQPDQSDIFKLTFDVLERKYFERLYAVAHGNVAEVARRSGKHESTCRDILKRLNIHKKR